MRDAAGAWRYAWGEVVPGARDLTIAKVMALGAEPLAVMRELGREVHPDLREQLVMARSVEMRDDPAVRAYVQRRYGAYVCGPDAPELHASVLLDGGQLADRLGVTRATIDSYRTRGRLPEPQVVRGRTPLWSVPIVLHWLDERGRPRSGRR